MDTCCYVVVFFPFLQLLRYSLMPGASCLLPTSKTSFTHFLFLARCFEGVIISTFMTVNLKPLFFVNLRIKPLIYLNRKLPHTTIKRYFATWALPWVRGFFSARATTTRIPETLHERSLSPRVLWFMINMLIFEKVSLLSFFTVLFNKSLFFATCKIDFAMDSLTHTANRPLPRYTAPQFQNEFPDTLGLSFKMSSQIHCASISNRVLVQNIS